MSKKASCHANELELAGHDFPKASLWTVACSILVAICPVPGNLAILSHSIFILDMLSIVILLTLQKSRGSRKLSSLVWFTQQVNHTSMMLPKVYLTQILSHRTLSVL